jgi:hypothetical protein
MRASLTKATASDLEAHVKAEMSDFKDTKIQEAYETFLFKQKKRLEDEFFAKNEFRTTVQGLKIRGSYDTYAEATHRAKSLQKIDPSFNVFVGQVGFWLPWDPEPADVADQEYADDQLNQLMRKYKENESQRDEFYAEEKQNRIKGAKVRDATKESSASEEMEKSDIKMAGVTDMFTVEEDLVIKRKREAAEAKAAEAKATEAKKAENVIVHS